MARLNLVLLLCCFVGVISGATLTVKDGDTDLNSVVDTVIATQLQPLTTAGADSIQLPSFYQDIAINLGPLKIDGKVNLTGGILTNLTSLIRDGDVMKYQVGANKIVLSLVLKLSDLELKNQIYDVSFGIIKSQGSISVACTDNQITVKFAITKESEGVCRASLDSFAITRLGGFSVQMEPVSVQSELEEQVIDTTLNLVSEQARNFLNLFFGYVRDKLIGVTTNCAEFKTF